jgi:hypothetical protein
MINNLEIIRPLLNFEKPGDFYMLYVFKRKKDQPEGERDNHQSVRTIKTYCIESIDHLERRWDEVIARSGDAVLTTRPAEGDIVYFPLTKAYFEIKMVQSLDPFFQVGKLYVYKLQCELMQFSSEIFDTGISEIDSQAADHSLDINEFNVLLETGDRFLLEYYTASCLVLQSYNVSTILPNVINEPLTGEISVLDFSEHNPFGELIQ